MENLLSPAEFERLRRDIAFARALRRLKVVTAAGENPLQYEPCASNAILDLRTLTPTGVTAAHVLPAVAGYTNAYLTTDGTTLSWTQLDPETIVWRNGILAAGGTFASRSILIADRLIKAIKAASFNAELVYFLPFLGRNIIAARMPLRDSLGVGMAGSTGFVDADFSQATGLQGNGANKFLDTKFKPGALNAGLGGVGYWIRSAASALGAHGVASSASGGEIYGLQFRITGGTLRRFWWGDGNSITGDGTGPASAHYYGQRSATNMRQFFVNGSVVATNTTAGILTSGINDVSMYVFAFHQTAGTATQFSGDAASCFYATKGTLSAAQITELHTILNTYLITPTGR